MFVDWVVQGGKEALQNIQKGTIITSLQKFLAIQFQHGKSTKQEVSSELLSLTCILPHLEKNPRSFHKQAIQNPESE